MNCIECSSEKEVKTYILERRKVELCIVCKEKYYITINCIKGLDVLTPYTVENHCNKLFG